MEENKLETKVDGEVVDLPEDSLTTSVKELVEMHPDLLKIYDQADRSDWTWDMYVVACQEIGNVGVYARWLLGKMGSEIVTKHGEGSVERFAKELPNTEYSTLRGYIAVYRKFTAEDKDYMPDGFLSWGVLRMAARTSEPIAVANMLADNNAKTIEAAHRKIQEAKNPNANPVPKKPSIKLRWNKEVEKYDIDLDDNDFGLINWGEVGKRLSAYLITLWEEESGVVLTPEEE